MELNLPSGAESANAPWHTTEPPVSRAQKSTERYPPLTPLTAVKGPGSVNSAPSPRQYREPSGRMPHKGLPPYMAVKGPGGGAAAGPEKFPGPLYPQQNTEASGLMPQTWL